MTKFKGVMCWMLLAASAVFSQTPDPARWRAANYSDVRYKLSITLEKGAAVMRGSVEIDVTLTNEGAKKDLILDWWPTTFENTKEMAFVDVWAVNQFRLDVLGSGQTLSNGHLAIPKELLKTGENVVKINFTSPIKTSGAAVTRYVDKEDGAEYIFGQFAAAGADTSFPLFDQPDLKARFQLSVIAPKDWKIVSNTRSSATNFDFGRTLGNAGKSEGSSFVFEETEPLAIGDFAFAAGDFAVFTDQANNGLVKTAPPGSTRIYEPMRDPNPAKLYVRKSQAEKFKAHAAEIFRLFRADDRETKNEIVLLPEAAAAPRAAAGLRFVGESDVFRDYSD